MDIMTTDQKEFEMQMRGKNSKVLGRKKPFNPMHND